MLQAQMVLDQVISLVTTHWQQDVSRLVLYVILYLRRVLTHRIDVVPSVPELPVPVFEFQITKLSDCFSLSDIP